MPISKVDMEKFKSDQQTMGREGINTAVATFEPGAFWLAKSVASSYRKAYTGKMSDKSVMILCDIIEHAMMDLAYIFVLSNFRMMIEGLEMIDKGASEGMTIESVMQRIGEDIKKRMSEMESERGQETPPIVVVEIKDKGRNN